MNSTNSVKKLLKTIKNKFKKIINKDNKLIKKIKENKLVKDIDFSKVDEEKAFKIGLSATAIVLLAVAVNIRTSAYDIKLSQEDVGIIRKKSDLDKVLEELKTELSSTYKMDVTLGEDIEIEKIHALDNKLTSKTELKNKIKEKVTFLVEGYSLEVDGKNIGALKTKKEVEKVLAMVKEPFEKELGENEKLEKLEILEDVKIKKTKLPYYQITSEEKLHERLLNGGEDIKIHEVEVGESLWTIAQIYGTTMDELIEANSDRDPDKLQIGDEIRLVSSKPIITVATVSNIEYDEPIEFESEVETDSSKYTNEKELKVEGKEGKARVVAKEIKHNGVLISKNEVEREIVEEPVKEIVIQGTKEVPKTVATGSFLMPTRGRISSRYGMRNGRMHKGLDIAASKGTPIHAADGGTVVFSGYSGAYGNMIEIDHGNGYKTKYAHCSKLVVSKGEKVYKGQHIANVGNTGRSTGPHVHLEVLKNGQNQNPSSYVN